MISPESIVVSLDWAKKLKAADWPQERSVMIWCGCKPGRDSFVWQRRNDTFCELDLAAPTAEEILRQLPRDIPNETGRTDGSLRIYKGAQWELCYASSTRSWAWQKAPVLAHAAAAMYCHLVERHLH